MKQTKKNRYQKHAVKADRWDHNIASKVSSDSKEFRAEGRILGETVEETAPELWVDSFFEFYKAEPTLFERDEMEDLYRVNREVLSHLPEVRNFEALREYCMGDPFASADACVTLRPSLEAIYDRLQTARKMAQELQKKREELEQLLQSQESEGDGGEDGDGNEDGGGEDSEDDSPSLDEMVKQLQEEVAAQENSLDQEIESQGSSIRHTFKEGVSDALEQAEQMDLVQSLFPGGGEAGSASGNLTSKSYKKRKEAAQLLNDEKIRRAFEMVGAMKAGLQSMNRERVVEGAEEIVDMDLGSELSAIVLSEFVKLKDPRSRLKFMKDFHGDSLQIYDTVGHELVDNGDIIALVDVSGSMGGQRDVWAKAVALVLLHISRVQNRGFRGILFDTNTWEYDFRNDFTAAKVGSFIKSFSGGGTSFYNPLNIAQSWIEKDVEESGKTSADIVFITDGQAPLDDEWLDQWDKSQEELDFKTWGVMIGGYSNSILDRVCQGRVMTISDVTSDSEIKDLWANLKK